MARTVRDIMARDSVCLSSDASIQDAAKQMSEEDVGDVIVCEGDRPVGIVTDRDIVVRGLAEGRMDTKIGAIASADLVTISPERSANDAALVMRDRNIRRLPVVENDKLVGVLSIGDLAIELDDDSALADISAARPNK